MGKNSHPIAWILPIIVGIIFCIMIAITYYYRSSIHEKTMEQNAILFEEIDTAFPNTLQSNVLKKIAKYLRRARYISEVR
tara:strand:+ start:55 stop:294 length:240 start_codon:yes stop_codon:yes gene_type:complete